MVAKWPYIESDTRQLSDEHNSLLITTCSGETAKPIHVRSPCRLWAADRIPEYHATALTDKVLLSFEKPATRDHCSFYSARTSEVKPLLPFPTLIGRVCRVKPEYDRQKRGELDSSRDQLA